MIPAALRDAGVSYSDQPAPHLFHRDPLGLRRQFAVRVGVAVEPRQRATAELLGAQRGHVHEQKPIGDGR